MQQNNVIGIIGAMQVEIDALVAEMTEKEQAVISGVTFTSGLLCGRRVVVAVCGVGKVFAALCAQTMILKYNVSALLNTGVAGGLAPTLRVGDIVVATDVVQHDMDTTALGDPRGLISGIDRVYFPCDAHMTAALCRAAGGLGLTTLTGRVASGDLFVHKDSTKAAIKRDFDAAACEMEGAAIGHVAYVNGVPFAVLRAISDGGDGMEFTAFVKMAAKNSVAVTKAFLEEL